MGEDVEWQQAQRTSTEARSVCCKQRDKQRDRERENLFRFRSAVRCSDLGLLYNLPTSCLTGVAGR